MRRRSAATPTTMGPGERSGIGSARGRGYRQAQKPAGRPWFCCGILDRPPICRLVKRLQTNSQKIASTPVAEFRRVPLRMIRLCPYPSHAAKLWLMTHAEAFAEALHPSVTTCSLLRHGRHVDSAQSIHGAKGSTRLRILSNDHGTAGDHH